jgi:hypothetical protein
MASHRLAPIAASCRTGDGHLALIDCDCRVLDRCQYIAALKVGVAGELHAPMRPVIKTGYTRSALTQATYAPQWGRTGAHGRDSGPTFQLRDLRSTA